MQEKKFSTPEIAQKLERGKISPKVLDQSTLGACVEYYRNKKYDDLKITGILKVKTVRSIQRYLERYMGEIRLELGEYFQQNEVAKAASNMERRIQRMERLLDSDKHSVSEEIKIIMATEQIEKDRIAMLTALGYFNPAQSQQEVIAAYEKAVEERKLHEALGSKWAAASQLSPGQKQVIANYNDGTDFMSPHELVENCKKIEIIVDLMLEENRQKMAEVLSRFNPVVASSKLRCNVFVINMLCNN